MRKNALLVLALGALIAFSAVGIASAARGEKPVTVRVGNLELTANGGFRPKALSRRRQTPIAFWASGKVREADGGHPPAIRKLVLEADRAGKVHLRGIPTCRAGQLQARGTKAALRVCGRALIGKGTTIAQVAFAEQRPIDVRSKLLVFNGGERHGKAKMYIHAYFSSPISGAIVTRVTIKKIHRGRFGTRVVARIPRITGGHGSITSFHLRIFKHVRGRRGRWRNPISSTCRDGRLKVHVLGRFEDGTRARTEVIRACKRKR